MFVLDPDPYVMPCYRIGPFTTRDIALHAKLPDSKEIDNYFSARFGNREFTYTMNGREAIHIALSSYNLETDDLVTILTTSGNHYITGCVTGEIEKCCRWNREIVPETKLLFVNHEFGTVYPDMKSLVDTGIPIIEDCCTNFFTTGRDNRIGSYGDFSVYSFTKMFPVQVGGLLVKNKAMSARRSKIDAESLAYIRKVLSHEVNRKEQLLNQRANIYDYGLSRFSEMGFTARFPLEPGFVPYALVLNNHGIITDLESWRDHMWKHGIQHSIFYGEDAFFLPAHQNLSETDIDYFVSVITNFILKQLN
jgi:dTDP-4-amino-4,6-dideoxygalactose transaminase